MRALACDEIVSSSSFHILALPSILSTLLLTRDGEEGDKEEGGLAEDG